MHRPERWGYVQFSTARAGTATFRPDPARRPATRCTASTTPSADYHKQHGRYSANLVGLVTGLGEHLSDPRLEATRGTFEATVELRRPDGRRRRWRITQDAKVGRE